MTLQSRDKKQMNRLLKFRNLLSMALVDLEGEISCDFCNSSTCGCFFMTKFGDLENTALDSIKLLYNAIFT